MADTKEPLNLSVLGSSLPSPGLTSGDWIVVEPVKDKFQPLPDNYSDVLGMIGPKTKNRVEALRKLQVRHDELHANFLEERVALEAKYQKLYEPLYDERFEIVNGVVEVESNTDESTEGATSDVNAIEEKGIPVFWLTALNTNEVLVKEIKERDVDALQYLKDIKRCRIDNPKGFKLEFFFDPNPFFKNSILTKTYHVIEDDKPILEKAIGTEIEWLRGKCLTQKILRKRPSKSSEKLITRKCKSFFNFFNPPQDPDENANRYEVEAILKKMEQDYEIGTLIRDKTIPYAVSWFTGEAVEGEVEDMNPFDLDSTDDSDLLDIEEEDDEEEVESYDQNMGGGMAGVLPGYSPRKRYRGLMTGKVRSMSATDDKQ